MTERWVAAPEGQGTSPTQRPELQIGGSSAAAMATPTTALIEPLQMARITPKPCGAGEGSIGPEGWESRDPTEGRRWDGNQRPGDQGGDAAARADLAAFKDKGHEGISAVRDMPTLAYS